MAPLFSSFNLTVTNTGKQDFVAPTVSTGRLLRTKVSVSSVFPYLGADVTVADNLSGAYGGQLYLIEPDGRPVGGGTEGPLPINKSAFQFGDGIASNSPLGTWTIAGYQVCDVAGNCLTNRTPADVQNCSAGPLSRLPNSAG